MTDIKVSTLGVPRTPRNKRIYAQSTVTERVSIGQPILPLSVHYEAKKLKYDNGDFTTRDVAISFNTSFLAEPTGYIKVYRMTNEPDGWMKQDVICFFDSESDWLNEYGFTINIADYEALDGVIIEYFFTEQS